MRRWIVYRAGRYAWTANLEGELPRKLFHTWREALAYADRQARTVEVVLPRNHGLNKVLLATADKEVFANYDNDDYLVIDNYRKGPKPLALALLALHYQQEVGQ